MRLVDWRWAGTAVGVGTQEFVGRVHLCQIQIEDIFLPSSNRPVAMPYMSSVMKYLRKK